MLFETIIWEDNKIKIIDQTLLPVEYKQIECDTLEDIWEAIKKLKVRGAPAIGVAGALGAYIGVRDIKTTEYKEFVEESNKMLDYLESCRPTAVNLRWAIEGVRLIISKSEKIAIDEIKNKILDYAVNVLKTDINICKNIGEQGEKLISDNAIILTHCNAGALATSAYGTALSVIYAAKEKGKKVKVYADETRPLLQGSRLTAWELMKNEIDVTVICDNMAGHVIRDKGVDCVIVGADRIASNGDTANKIGTYGLAVIAQKHNIPFYVAAPISTFDFNIKTGADIPIEERPEHEVSNGFGKRTAPEGVKIYNPAFDVTPAEMISAIITEKGVLYPSFSDSIKGLLK
jgi:methylthioribose-1-phosphate isomerase